MQARPVLPDIESLSSVPTGDMPGDSVQIGRSHVDKARTIMARLWELLLPMVKDGRAVVSVHGGSGVGKSEIGSLLAHYLRANGIGAYVLSGDNYPHRIPSANDAERLRVFRAAGLRALVDAGLYDSRVKAALKDLRDRDADPSAVAEHPWLESYQRGGRAALREYLGTDREIDFDEINAIIGRFRDGAQRLELKRMGRQPGELWYDTVDLSDVQVLVIEWTHGNNERLRGVDVPILLNSTPEETLAHRRSRARDGATDSPFTTLVLQLEQEKLHAQAPHAAIIVTKAGELVDYATYLKAMGKDLPDPGAMLNVYPDSIGGNLAGTAAFVAQPAVRGAFTSAYLLPSVFDSDLDRGFSVISYDLNARYATHRDIDALADAGLSLKFDVVLNHASVLSPQFQDLLKRGERSKYKDFFIDWNKFWAGHGRMTEEGYIQPDEEVIGEMFFRKPGLPILMVRFPDGTEKPYWNTFYQEVRYRRPEAEDIMEATGLQYGRADELAQRLGEALAEGRRPAEMDFSSFEDAADDVVEWLESRRRYLGQMDLNIESPLVWDFYAETLDRLRGYGAEIVRLDAFAYSSKVVGERNFLNEPGTWDVLDRVRELADARGLTLLPEIHGRYEEGIHETLAEKGFLTYDFFLPGLIIDALHRGDASVLVRWLKEVIDRKIRTVTMLGCHDGIPLLDLKGLLTEEQIQGLIELVVSRGGYVKDLHGSKATYYQVNATYFSALGESEDAMLLARALHLFTPGKPQVWYLDLFAGTNDHEAVALAGAGGHKEINRTNLDAEDAAARLTRPVVQRQLELLRFRNTFGAFGWDAECEVVQTAASRVTITWRREGHEARLDADLANGTFTITADGEVV